MRELNEDLIKRVATDYGMEVAGTNVFGTTAQLRAIMEWARDEARAFTIRDYLFKEQAKMYPGLSKQTTQGEH